MVKQCKTFLYDGYSCQDVLLRFIDNCKERADKGINSGAILTDISKAFDTLNHGLFIAKLSSYGVNINACKLIASYFSCRKQRVNLGSCKCSWLNIDIGAPQGSLFGPLAYNVFTNDLLLLIEQTCEIYNYADDNSICCFGKNVTGVQNKLQNVSNVMMN